ncbi:MAG: MOSC domain-containing protein [Pirellulales bacterium]
MIVDSDSRGEPARFRALADLEIALEALPAAPTQRGCVALVVSRRENGRRETPARVRLTPEGGVPGDAWGRHSRRQADEQIAVMQLDVARLVANGQALTLSGDNLILDLDLSAGNLPPGSRVRVGSAVLEVTPTPHDGCRKFRGRFGDGALRLVSKAELRHRNLRGIYMRVVEEGEAGPGDPVEVIARSGN